MYARENGHADVIKALEGSRVGRTTGADAQAAALNDVAQGIDRFGYRAYAASLVAILLNANPPACVGLYAKWGSGKSFFIQLLKEEFDRQARALVKKANPWKPLQRHPRTGEWQQWFECDESPAVESKNSPRILVRLCHEAMQLFWFLCSALTELLPTVPYWVITLTYVFDEAFPKVLAAMREVAKFRRCKSKAKVAPTPESGHVECVKEYVYVDFNAWEYAASDELWAGLIRALYDKVESRIKRQPAPPEKRTVYRDGYYKRMWRATRAVKALKKQYGRDGLYRITVYSVLVCLAVLAVLVMELTGRVAFVQTARESVESAIAVALAVLVTVLAVVPAGMLAVRSKRESGQSRGEKIFQEAKSVKDRLGFLATVRAARPPAAGRPPPAHRHAFTRASGRAGEERAE